jgi:hypothetical protein
LPSVLAEFNAGGPPLSVLVATSSIAYRIRYSVSSGAGASPSRTRPREDDSESLEESWPLDDGPARLTLAAEAQPTNSYWSK